MNITNYNFTSEMEYACAEEMYLDLMRNAGVRPLKSIRATTAKVTDWYTETVSEDCRTPIEGQIKIQVLYSYRTKVACAITSPLLPHVVTICQWRGYSDTTNKQISKWTDSVIKELGDRGYIKEVTIVRFKSHDYYGYRKNPIKKG